ncbi:hypothetical protein [Pseudomonas sp. NPDC089569]|uniref:hypothetical protein n=1 Tax=Pseudomonas sp. NPDC089569 TaxID=3390722 RepID=UPI003D05C6E8
MPAQNINRERADGFNLSPLQARSSLAQDPAGKQWPDPVSTMQSVVLIAASMSAKPTMTFTSDITPAYPITHKKATPCQAKASSKNNFH